MIRLQTEIALSTTEAEYIYPYQATRDVLTFVSLMKKIEFVIKLQGDTPTVLCSLLKIQSDFTKKIKGQLHLQFIRTCNLCNRAK